MSEEWGTSEELSGSEGVSGEGVYGTGNDARLAMLNAINDANDTAKADEFQEYTDDGATVEFVPENTEQSEEHAETGDDAELAAEAAPSATRTYKIKVNGAEKELSEEEVLARAQKVEAADAYLAEAARIRKQAADEYTEYHRQQQQPSRQDVEAGLLEERRALARAIQMGTEEEAIAAIARLQQTTQSPPLNRDELMRTVDERLNFQEAVGVFKRDYTDIVTDPILSKIASDRDQELLAAGDKRSYMERFRAIGDDLRSWKAEIVKGATPAMQEVKAEDKRTRKAAAPSVPQAASKKSAPMASDDEKEESYADIIAGIARHRGGPQWTRA